MTQNNNSGGIGMRIVPYGCGWEDIYLNIGETRLYFSVSTVQGGSTHKTFRLPYKALCHVVAKAPPPPLIRNWSCCSRIWNDPSNGF